MDELVEQGLDVNATGLHGYNLLFWALRSSEPKSFEKLLQLGADPDALTETGKSVTYLAADSDDSRYLSLALEYGADVNGISTAEMDTPLFRALGAKSLNNTLILIKNDADVNFQNKFGETPAMVASALRNFTFVDLMIKNGADHCIDDRWGKDLFYSLEKAESLMDKSAAEYQIVKRLLQTLPACGSE
ncbi:ankyrin repeat domain-containing protein [Alteromonas sp. A081]|uniref:ankyrin repeat domain-containing protein n=1 Tax=Alteromonas sp. A081 TaxID=3410269 RepID=UPI003B9805DD